MTIKDPFVKSMRRVRNELGNSGLRAGLTEVAQYPIDRVVIDTAEQLKYGTLKNIPIGLSLVRGTLPNGEKVRMGVVVFLYPNSEEPHVAGSIGSAVQQAIDRNDDPIEEDK
jgi:hypothetical protein